MARIIFLNRFFYPDHSATGQILSDLAFDLSAAGRDVTVVTSRQRYDHAGADLPAHEAIKGVTVVRVPTTRYGRRGLIGRGFDYLSYYRATWRALTDRSGAAPIGPGDILVAKTDPPLLSVLAMKAAARTGAHLVNWLQDLYPEVAIELGVPLVHGPVARLLADRRNLSLRAARANVVLGQAMAERLAALGIAPAATHIIANWARDDSIVPVAAAANPLRHEWGLADKFVVGYSGNLGRAHDYEPVLAAAERLRGQPRIAFVFVGGGRQFDEVARRTRARRLGSTVRFFPYQDDSVLTYSLSVPDLHWLSLKPALEGLIFPSKFYGIAAAGRAMAALTAPDGEIARLVGQHDCGAAFDPADVDGLTGFIDRLAGDPARCADMGRRARMMLNSHFSRARALARWHALLETVG